MYDLLISALSTDLLSMAGEKAFYLERGTSNSTAVQYDSSFPVQKNHRQGEYFFFAKTNVIFRVKSSCKKFFAVTKLCFE